jgi:hypothetical protein
MAEAALILWVPISFSLFVLFRPVTAVGAGILAGLLLLPTGVSFDFPIVPALGKHRISILGAFVACLALAPRRLRRPRMGPAQGFAVLLIGSSFLTAITNLDPINDGAIHLPALALWDGVSLAGAALLDLVLPFYLGWTLYRQPRDLGQLLNLITVTACLYSLLILFEVRMSPRLHYWVYGYQSWYWYGELRGGGFRPVVFMRHGLMLAIFAASCCIAAVAMFRARERLLLGGFLRALRVPTGPISVYLIAVLLACRSLGAFVSGAGGAMALFFLRSRIAMLLAVGLSAVVIFYPMLRSFDLFPTETLVNVSGIVSEDRAESLDYRFRHETRLLNRAQERPWFGWGAWRRNRVHDPRTGLDTSVTDGYWVITLGVRGALGFIGTFGLLLTPVFASGRRFGTLRSRRDRWFVAGTAWIVAVNAIDLLPNAMLNSFIVFVAGALTGATAPVGSASGGTGVRRARRRRYTAGSEPIATTGAAPP